MKRLSIFILSLFLVTMFNSCEDEEVASIIGKWLFGSSTYSLYEDNVLVSSGDFEQMEFLYLEILKGGTGYVWFDAVEYETFSWQKDGKTFTIYEGPESDMIFKIEELSKTTLKLSLTEEEEDGGVVYKMVIYLSMTRVND